MHTLHAPSGASRYLNMQSSMTRALLLGKPMHALASADAIQIALNAELISCGSQDFPMKKRDKDKTHRSISA